MNDLCFEAKYKKTQIVLHHTSGSHQPYWTIAGWKAKKNHVATPFVIGGKSNNPKYPDDFDGKIVECFNPKYWAYHLGISEKNHFISKGSIGIEICNYGPLVKTNKGVYLNHVNGLVPADQVTQCSFRNFNYYESYTDAQLLSLQVLLHKLSDQFNIDLHEGLYARLKKMSKTGAFESTQPDWPYPTMPGLWTHTNYRADKTDCSPQDNLCDMILSL